jgi:hypothetical protein
MKTFKSGKALRNYLDKSKRTPRELYRLKNKHNQGGLYSE